jgi:hypothetical protein
MHNLYVKASSLLIFGAIINIFISTKDTFLLTFVFFGLTFLCACQDVALDGWAISLLSKENVSWQSTCNNAGFNAGILVSETLFIILDSVTFSNNYVRPLFHLPAQNHGLINLEGKL